MAVSGYGIGMDDQLEKQCDDLATHLLQLEQKSGLRKQRRANSSLIKFKLSTVWLCKRLLAAHAASANAGMRISRDKNRYRKSRYLPEGISYDVTVLGVLALMDMDGWVSEVRKGAYERSTGEGKQTRIVATKKLVDWFSIDSNAISKTLVGFEDCDPLVVQITSKRKETNEKGKVVIIKTKTLKSYKDTNDTIRMRENLYVINNCLKRHWSDLYLSDDDWVRLQESLLSNKEHDYSPIKLHRQTIKRVFNSLDFNVGGRFYGGWWQNIPKAYRSLVTIDGKRTVEFDYSTFYPVMLYALKGLELSGDAYDIGIGQENRGLVKELFNSMVHSPEPKNRPPRGVRLRHTGKSFRELRDLIYIKHEPIRDMFYCGMGNRLQFYDSQIAEQVMLYFAKRDVPVLPVHDSFLIQGGLKIDLIEVMRKVFKKLFDVPITIKDGATFVPVSTTLDDRVEVDEVVKHTEEFDSWFKRNA